MKKLLIAAIAALSLVGMQAMASVSIDLSAADILDNASNLAPLNTVGLWIVDTSGGASLSPSLSLGENIAVGATLTGTTDKILVAADINNTTSTIGSIDLAVVNSPYPAGFASGQKFAIIWLVNQALSVTTAQAGYFGEFYDSNAANDSQDGDAWVLPPDGTTTSFDMTTASESGNILNSAGIASLQIIPEPSSIMLVVMGLLGGMGLIRRRR